MPKLPHMPFFVDDYEAATPHLSPEEDGIYFRLLRLCWRTPGCSVPMDKAWLMRHLRIDEATFERAAKVVIDEFWQCQNGRIFQKRQREIFNEVTTRVSSLREAGKQGGLAKSRKMRDITPSDATPLLGDNSSQALASKTKTKTKEDTPLSPSRGEQRDLIPEAEKPKRKPVSKPFPKDWRPGPSTVAWAMERGLSERHIQDLADACLSHHLSKGTLYIDHDQAFQTWVRNDAKFSANNPRFTPASGPGDGILRRIQARAAEGGGR